MLNALTFRTLEDHKAADVDQQSLPTPENPAVNLVIGKVFRYILLNT